MSGAPSRLRNLASQIFPSASPTPPETEPTHRENIHTLSPTLFLPRAAAVEPNALAIHHTTATGLTLRRSYQDLADRARGLGYYLKKHSYRRIGILLPNTPAFLESIYGIAAAGAVNAAANYRLIASDIAYIFVHADVELIIVDREFVDLLEEYKNQRPRVKFLVDDDDGGGEGPFDEAIKEGLRYDEENGRRGWCGGTLEPQTQNEEDVIALAYTSGTTARPKGVEFTHRGAYLGALANVVESGLNLSAGGGGCRYLWTLPMFHAMGWTFPWAVTAVRGTHYCLRKIDYGEIWRLLRDEGITHYNAAPTVNTLLGAHPGAKRLERTVHVTVAASPPTPRLFEQMMELNLHPVHVYGLTETYGPITKGYQLPEWEGLPKEERYKKMARQGHGFLTSLPIRVIKTGEDVPEGKIRNVKKNGEEIGEIVCLGNICAKGYYKDAEATRKLFAGGVLHTGDLAVWHPDGSAQILDRAKDIIISGGENISSVSLESMLATHPAILEVGVVAVSDEHWGERPKAFVTVQEGKEVQGEEVIAWAKKNPAISRFMVPREVEIIPELPKTSTGKVKKNVLREWAKGGDRTME